MTDRDTTCDDGLMAALRSGDMWAFEELHTRYLDQVFSYVLYRVSQREEAEDITCEVFAAALEAAASFRGTSGPLPWLFGIARRKIVDHLRRAAQEREIRESDLPEGQPSPFDTVDWTQELPEDFLLRQDVIHNVRRAMRQLPDEQREALLLRYVEGRSLEEISSVLRRSQDAVKGLLRRGKRRLAELLSPDGSHRERLRADARPSRRAVRGRQEPETRLLFAVIRLLYASPHPVASPISCATTCGSSREGGLPAVRQFTAVRS